MNHPLGLVQVLLPNSMAIWSCHLCDHHPQGWSVGQTDGSDWQKGRHRDLYQLFASENFWDVTIRIKQAAQLFSNTPPRSVYRVQVGWLTRCLHLPVCVVVELCFQCLFATAQENVSSNQVWTLHLCHHAPPTSLHNVISYNVMGGLRHFPSSSQSATSIETGLEVGIKTWKTRRNLGNCKLAIQDGCSVHPQCTKACTLHHLSVTQYCFCVIWLVIQWCAALSLKFTLWLWTQNDFFYFLFTVFSISVLLWLFIYL